MQNYQDRDINASFSYDFRTTMGWKWAQYVVILGALKSMSNVLLVGAVGQARYIAHIAKAHILPPLFSVVVKK